MDRLELDVYFNNIKTTLHLHPRGEVVSDYMRHINNYFEIDFLKYIYDTYPVHGEILDIGANIGNHSVFFSKFLNCERVHCFEPYEPNINLLKKNMSSFGDKCQLYTCALSNKEGTMSLYNSQQGNFGGFSLHQYSNGSSFKVLDSIKVTTLDSYTFNNVTMMKIDVENHENEVLEGAKQTITKHKPIIFLENLNHNYPNVVPEKEPHGKILSSYNYIKIDSNICNSNMDLWVPIN